MVYQEALRGVFWGLSLPHLSLVAESLANCDTENELYGIDSRSKSDDDQFVVIGMRNTKTSAGFVAIHGRTSSVLGYM
jgi:hypothetical protein